MTTKDTTGPGPASAPDLDVWRAEAGACAPLDAAATRGPWRSTWGDDEEADAERGKKGEEVTIEAVGREGYERLVLGVTWYDGLNPCCREEDAAFIAAARTGWPRDAARVARLCTLLAEAEHNVRTLRAALAVAERAASLCAGEVVEARTAAPAATRVSLINALASAGAARVAAESAFDRARADAARSTRGRQAEAYYDADQRLREARETETAARAALDAFERADREADPCPGSRGF